MASGGGGFVLLPYINFTFIKILYKKNINDTISFKQEFIFILTYK
jgi:hypothetical protein